MTHRPPPSIRRARLTPRLVLVGLAAGGVAAVAACGPATSSSESGARPYAASDVSTSTSGSGATASMPGMSMAPAMTTSTDATANPPGPTPVLTGTPDAARGGVDISLTTEETDIEIAPGVMYHAWTFGGHVPGPVIRVTEGTLVHFTLTNKGNMPHSIDFHALQVAPDQDYRSINPGQSLSFDFTAHHAGVFMYHCGSPMVIEHMANGMYGTIIVDPPTPRPAAREYVVVQSEWYSGPTAVTEMIDGTAKYVVFNGYQNRYKLSPLSARPGELVRIYMVNAGPNHFSAFHVVGALFSTVAQSGSDQAQTHWVQTATVAPGDAAMFELTMADPGTYSFVTHSFGDVSLGAVGAIKVSADAKDQPLAP